MKLGKWEKRLAEYGASVDRKTKRYTILRYEIHTYRLNKEVYLRIVEPDDPKKKGSFFGELIFGDGLYHDSDPLVSTRLVRGLDNAKERLLRKTLTYFTDLAVSAVRAGMKK